MYDVVVAGGGPAGMTAALYCLRNGKSVLVIEKNGFGGQMTNSPKIENYPGSLSISGTELADKMMEQVLAQGADIEIETVCGVVSRGTGKVVMTEEGSLYEAKAVILAVGVKHRMLGLPGEDELVGEGISFCAVCDGDFYTNKVVCVAGGGNSALQEAVLLSDKCAQVNVLQNLDRLTGEETMQKLLLSHPNVNVYTNTTIAGLVKGDDGLSGVQVLDSVSGQDRVIDCDGLFVAIGLIPENEAFADVADLDARGYFAAGEDCLTRTPGVFVAGDCRSKGIRQITTAAADGAVAALAACNYINAL